MSNRAQYSQWPFLTEDEFELACAYLDRKYVGARLGPTRKIFKLRVRRTAAVGGAYVDILRLLEPPEEEEELAIALGKLTGGDTVAPEQGNEVEMVDEDQDHEALRPDSGRVHGDAPPGYSIYSHQPYVTYEIHLHPTYRMPTLWFALHDLPMREPTFDLDSVYRYLVPPQYKSSLREMGAMGGISAAVSLFPGPSQLAGYLDSG
ncbi:hypothetical protein B7494_g1189 [Chlorociboria aeruginascens]|nr:hypothetical protein B7494_g1189 [Chlorociboria aeruginascens]